MEYSRMKIMFVVALVVLVAGCDLPVTLDTTLPKQEYKFWVSNRVPYMMQTISVSSFAVGGGPWQQLFPNLDNQGGLSANYVYVGSLTLAENGQGDIDAYFTNDGVVSWSEYTLNQTDIRIQVYADSSGKWKADANGIAANGITQSQ